MGLPRNNYLLKAGFIALILFHPALFAQPQPMPETDRLIATGKLWATVKYFHPYLAYRDIDWDKALVDALPKILSATSTAEYAAALRSMLDALHDPATYTVTDTPSHGSAILKIENRPDGTVVVSQTESTNPAPDSTQQVIQALTSARRVVFDLRVQPGAPDYLSNLLDNDSVGKLLTRTPLDTPAQRTWVHNGLPAAFQTHEGVRYSTAFYTKAGTHIEGDSSMPERRVAFILNENSPLPHIGCALRAAGQAVVLAESNHFQFADVASAVISMGQGVSAIVRLSEPLASQEVTSVCP